MLFFRFVGLREAKCLPHGLLFSFIFDLKMAGINGNVLATLDDGDFSLVKMFGRSQESTLEKKEAHMSTLGLVGW